MAFIKFAASQLQQIGEKKRAQEAAAKPAIEEAAPAAAPAQSAAEDAGAADANKLQTEEAKRIVEDITDSITGEKKESEWRGLIRRRALIGLLVSGVDGETMLGIGVRRKEAAQREITNGSGQLCCITNAHFPSFQMLCPFSQLLIPAIGDC